MPRSRAPLLALLTLLAAASSACSPPPPARPELLALLPNPPPPEPTRARAGADRCALGAPVDLGPFANPPGRSIALGFGERGGLAAWTGPPGTGIRARPLGRDGKPVGPEVAFPLPEGAVPEEVVPAVGGFVVLAQRLQRGMCKGRCVDATCSGWPAGTPQPQVCSHPCLRPCPHLDTADFVAQRAGLDGRPFGPPDELHLGKIAIEAVLPGRASEIGVLTGDRLLTLRLGPDGALEIAETALLPRADYALPVRGEGPPSVLLLEESGAARLLGGAGAGPVLGSVLDAQAGRIVDARLQARWGQDGRVHLARQAWHRGLGWTHHAVLEEAAIRFDPAPLRGPRAPFEDYVEPHLDKDGVWRGTWLQQRVGETFSPRAVDPDADPRQMRVAWTGAAFVVAYATPGGLRAVVADCSGR